MSYHTGNNNNNNRSTRSTQTGSRSVSSEFSELVETQTGDENRLGYLPTRTPPTPTSSTSTPPTPTQRSGNTNQSDRNPLREVTSTGSDRGGFEARECPDEAPDGNGKPLTDDGSVWENPPPCSTIFVWDYEGGVWVRQEGEGKPDDAIEGGGTGEGSGLTDEQAREWQFYRDFLDWYFNQILLILSDPFRFLYSAVAFFLFGSLWNTYYAFLPSAVDLIVFTSCFE